MADLPAGFGAQDAPPCEAKHMLEINAQHDGWKLAKYVSVALPGWSRNAAAACSKDGTLRVNGERSGANRVLQVGDLVGVYAEPPAVADDDTSGPTLSVEQINALITQRLRAKAARDFGTADSIYAELLRSKVRLDDRNKTWKAPGGLSGVQTDLSAEEIVALRGTARKKQGETAEQPNAVPNATATAASEAERRRLKNLKKRQGRARKADGAGSQSVQSATADVSAAAVDRAATFGAADTETGAGEAEGAGHKRKGAPE